MTRPDLPNTASAAWREYRRIYDERERWLASGYPMTDRDRSVYEGVLNGLWNDMSEDERAAENGETPTVDLTPDRKQALDVLTGGHDELGKYPPLVADDVDGDGAVTLGDIAEPPPPIDDAKWDKEELETPPHDDA